VGHNFFIFRDLESSQVPPHHIHGLLLQCRRAATLLFAERCVKGLKIGYGMLCWMGHAFGYTRAWPAD